MLRPEQMSKVSVTGSKAVIDDVIETVHDINLVHLESYDDSWAGFQPGTPAEGADERSEKLVTVRSIESILDIDEEDAGPSRIVDESAMDAEIEETRQRVNELDDRRATLREQLRDVEERIDALEPFARLGIDLDLLSGYDSLDVQVVEGREEAIVDVLDANEDVETFETFAEGGVVAIFAYPVEDGGNVISDALVGVEVTVLSVPDAESSPQEYVEELEHRRQQLESKLRGVENDLDEVTLDAAGFLLAAEEQLSIEVQKAEAPLSFATTERSFVAEGWIPSDRYPELEMALTDAVGERVVVEELERMDYDIDGHAGHEQGAGEGTPVEQPTATDGGREDTTMHDENPPVVLDNFDPAKPFEMLVNLVNRPKYTELDPTLLVFLTFPFAFGFMIGDIGYGLLYMAIGAFMYRFDSKAVQALGAIALWAGGFTVLFGYLYGELFGVHLGDLGLGFLPLTESISKGLHAAAFAELWLVVAILFGLIHLNIGLVMGFVNELRHGLHAAVYEKGSWLLTLNGFFVWIFSTSEAGSLGLGTDLSGAASKPDLLVGTDSALYEFVGFVGVPEAVGVVALVLSLVGIVMIGIGEGIAGLVEWPAWAFGHVLSYLRITAVLLAKAGMAFAVNLLVFGAYADDAGHITFHLPGADLSGYPQQEFAGLIHTDPLFVTIPLAILVFVFGHVLVMVLGITAAGIQMIRLEYVEFFQKFYEGGGEEYEPFGYSRTHTAE